MKSKTRCLDCNGPIDDDETRCKRCERAAARAIATNRLRGIGPAYAAARAKVLDAPSAICWFCRASASTTVAHIPPLALRHTSPAHWVGRLVPSCPFCLYQRDPGTLR